MPRTIKYFKLRNLNEQDFRQVTGVNKEVFHLIETIVKTFEKNQTEKRGRKNKLNIKDQILLLLEYYRDYRTYKSLSVDYKLDESNVYRTRVCPFAIHSNRS